MSCIGLFFTLILYFVNRGSSFWHANWDAHVHMLEDKVIGPMHRAVLDDSEFDSELRFGALNYSVTRLNEFLCLYLTVVWIGLACASVLDLYGVAMCRDLVGIGAPGITLLFIFAVLNYGKRKGTKSVRRFRLEELNRPGLAGDSIC